MFAEFIKDEEGAIMAEYGMLAVFIAVAAVAAVILLGQVTVEFFSDPELISIF